MAESARDYRGCAVSKFENIVRACLLYYFLRIFSASVEFCLDSVVCALR